MGVAEVGCSLALSRGEFLAHIRAVAFLPSLEATGWDQIKTFVNDMVEFLTIGLEDTDTRSVFL